MAKPKKLDPENPAPVVDDENAETTAALHAYQDALVRKGLEDMRAGRVVSHEEVVKRLSRLKRLTTPFPTTEMSSAHVTDFPPHPM